MPNLCLHYVELNNKDNKQDRRIMATIRHMRRSAFSVGRQAGRPDKGNCLEGEYDESVLIKNCKMNLSPMLFFIGILVIRAEVCFAPCHHGLQDGDEALPKLGK